MSIDHNRIKVADLEKNKSNKILCTNDNGELEFSDPNIIFINDLTSGGTKKALTAEMGKALQNNKVDKAAGKNLLSDTEITRLGTLSNYTHPSSHTPGIITQDPDNRFVTDAEKATWNTKQASLGFVPENAANKNVASGYAGLGTDGKLISSQLPSITVNDTFVIASQAAMLALNVETGDIAVRTDLSKSFILKGTNPSVLADWQELLTPTSAVTNVFGRNGAITSQTGDYNADQISETANRKFQSANQQTFNDATSSIQTQLNSKVSTTGSGAYGNWPINITGNANTIGGLTAGSFMRSENSNGFYGMANSNGDTTDWIRTTLNGLLPYQSGNSGNIGTADWNFNSIYGVTLFENNTSLSNKYLGINANAVTATNLSSNRNNWNTNGTKSAVVGQLSWNNYGNGHTIFDASSASSPDGTSINNTNSEVAWTPTYPSLMGWNGANTFGLRVDSARISDRTAGASGNLYIDDNYGCGIVGKYSDTRYQGIYAMGDAYKLSGDGSTTGNCYGLAWTHSNIGGQSKMGLSHQLLVMEAGIAKTAIGTGLWTSGVISTGQASSALGNFGASNLWAGAQYPTLFSSSAEKWIMHANPHICYTENGSNGYTGSMTGSTIRFASNPAVNANWDLGVGVCSVGTDVFAIGRDGTAAVTINNSLKMEARQISVVGTGNDYSSSGLEVRGNGPVNSVFPSIGFHQPGVAASSLQLRGPSDFRFYAQGASSYANVTAAAITSSTTISAAQYFNTAPAHGNGYGFWGGHSSTYGILMSDSGNGNYGGRIAGETTSDYNMYFSMAQGVNRGFIFRNSINTPLLAIHENGVRASNDIIAFSSSDERLKDNIKKISNPIEKLAKINGYMFDWNANQNTHTGHDIGVIAQEIESIIPEIVTTRENGYKAVKYDKLVPLLIEVTKTQQTQIQEQQQTIETLNEKIKHILEHLNLKS
ncbi:tail fiber domain-containing protein [Flavobacterium sp.]|uniref:tail fiber domain-containing protein n=1 Tax=Flavobacterium sp. TaxID=239 RepID=UPI003D0F195B